MRNGAGECVHHACRVASSAGAQETVRTRPDRSIKPRAYRSSDDMNVGGIPLALQPKRFLCALEDVASNPIAPRAIVSTLSRTPRALKQHTVVFEIVRLVDVVV